MDLRDIGAILPPGFRFCPSDEELILHYLYKKIANEQVLKGTLVEIDLHTCEPWQLPEVAKLNSTEWYFFSFRALKYATGLRANRSTKSGYWKATGKDRTVYDPTTTSGAVVGMRKTLVFYINRAPNGVKTGWIMHEFRLLENPHLPPKEDWVLCRVFHKAKDEKSDKHCPQSTLETTAETSSPTLAVSPPTDLCQNKSPSTHSNFSMNPNFLQLYRDANETSISEMIMNPKCEDEYEFLFDMDFEDSSIRYGGASDLEKIIFEDDNCFVFH